MTPWRNPRRRPIEKRETPRGGIGGRTKRRRVLGLYKPPNMGLINRIDGAQTRVAIITERE